MGTSTRTTIRTDTAGYYPFGDANSNVETYFEGTLANPSVTWEKERQLNVVSTTDFAMSQKDCEFIAKIQGVIAEQLADENFSIDTLAEQMNMSRSNFYRKIKALSGMSPNDYLKTLRMNRAAELIVSGTRISEVAAQVGFTSSSYFAKCFKAQYGVLPKEYTGQPPISGEA